MEYEKKYTTASDGISEMYYEDPSCKVKLIVADFRDRTWWISAKKLINKRKGTLEIIPNKQKYELYRRISADARRELYTDEFELIEADAESIDYTKDILDIE